LSQPSNIVLPAIGAVGGMMIPALIYVALNKDSPDAIQGWAIPAATDIAFALGVLYLLGSRVPTSLKVFLTSIAIFDDIGAILIIAIFYTENISLFSLGLVAACVPILALLNWRGVEARSIYILVGLVMWAAMLKSGVHATLAGILIAFFIPLRSKTNPEHSPLKILEHDLHAVVAFFILPVFAFANAGINLSGVGIEQVMHSVPLGIALGLFFGKQIGVFGFCWLAVKMRVADLPAEMNMKTLYGVSALCGIGFTMSLFIGSLAFEATAFDMIFDERLGIIIGSIASGIVGYLLLRVGLPARAGAE
jgi:NhaA family Na+:H+ antiporter